MAQALPKSLDYTEQPVQLPEGSQNISVSITPSNKATFADSGDDIVFDLPQRGWINPASLSISYNLAMIQGNNAETKDIVGTPLYSPFVQSTVQVGSSIVENIQNYNQLCNLLVNTKLTLSQKESLAVGFGFNSPPDSTSVAAGADDAASVVSLLAATVTDAAVKRHGHLNRRTVAAAGAAGAQTKIPLSGPIGNIISMSERMLPLFAMEEVRITLTTEKVGELISGGAPVTYTGFEITDVELHFDILEIPNADSILSSMQGADGNITIKSQSYTVNSQSLQNASSGQQELVFNSRLASIKSLVSVFSGGNAGHTKNGKFDSVDVTRKQPGGAYQYFIGGTAVGPQRALAPGRNSAAVFSELGNTWSAPHDIMSSNMAITNDEFARVDNVDTDSQVPGKFFFGCSTEKATGPLMSGVSSMMSPINLRLNIPEQLDGTKNISLVALHDAVWQINLAGGMTVVRR